MNLRNKAPADAVVVDESVEGSGRKGMFVAGGVAAGLAVVAGMSYMLLSGGDDAAEAGVVASAKRSVVAQPNATAAPSSAPAIKKFNGKNARDPFKALVVEAAAVPAGASSGAGATPAPVVVPTTAPTIAPGTVPAPVTVPSTSPTSSRPAPTSTKASLIRITMVAVSTGDTTARIKVDGGVYDVKPQEEFGKYFKLLNLHDGSCGAIQYGDEAFDLCEGQSRNVR